jgi:hypothetical protein
MQFHLRSYKWISIKLNTFGINGKKLPCNENFYMFYIISVSFGGAAALFLGFSFLSAVELIFFLMEYLCTFIWSTLACIKQKVLLRKIAATGK